MDVPEEIGELGQVFLQAAEAAYRFQAGLDEKELLVMPRASVDLSFGAQVGADRGIRLVRRRRARRLLTHRLRFDVVATPRPVRRLAGEFRREFLYPTFLLTSEEQLRWRRRLSEDLRRDELAWRFPPDQSRANRAWFRKRLAREANRIDRSRRMIFFHLPGERLLAVRVAPGGSGKQDGLFVYEPQEARPWAIYNFEDDGAGQTYYSPLALLTRGLREWRASGEPSARTTEPFDAGISSLGAFQAGLEEGLGQALSELSQRFEQAPSGFDFGDVEALVGFTLGERVGVELDQAQPAVDPERDDMPASVVRIRLEPGAEPPQSTAHLVELEYLLAGEDRQTVVDLLVERAETDLRPYRARIEDTNHQDQVVVLRAFRRYKEHLLVIWPSAGGEDLVLACRRKWRHGRYELGRLDVLNDPGGHKGVVALVDSGEEHVQYRPFHRFFRTVLAWQRRE